MDRSERGGLDGTTLVNGVTSDVDDTAQGAVADGDLDGGAGVERLSTTDETLSTCLHRQPHIRMRAERVWQLDTNRPWQCSGRRSHPSVAADKFSWRSSAIRS